jgi:hypothetical protein
MAGARRRGLVARLGSQPFVRGVLSFGLPSFDQYRPLDCGPGGDRVTILTRNVPEARRRPRILRGAGIGAALVVAVTGIAWAGFTSVYTPFEPGSSGGPAK